jgi:CheY-like chemotaxis protein
LRLRVVHWNAKEAEPLVALLEAAGHSVDLTSSVGSGILKHLRAAPPEAVVIDLTRQPSHGREIGVAIRTGKTLKHLPILFVDGDLEKVEATRRVLPDAIYTARARLIAALKLARPVANPVRPAPMMERFGNRTAAQKLGINATTQVTLIDPPADCERLIGPLPETGTGRGLVLWFTHDPGSFYAGLPRMRALAAHSRLWILWRKKKPKNKANELDGGIIRRSAIDVGLVDYKICSVDATWSGMAFAVKKAQ